MYLFAKGYTTLPIFKKRPRAFCSRVTELKQASTMVFWLLECPNQFLTKRRSAAAASRCVAITKAAGSQLSRNR